MSDNTNDVVDTATPGSTQEGATPNALESVKSRFTSVEEAAQRVAELEAKEAKDAELLKKLRKFEKENASRADEALKEQGKWKELAEAHAAKLAEYETKAQERIVNAALEEALKDSKAKSITTVMKLIDKTQIKVEGDVVDTKALSKMISDLQKSDPVLFEDEAKAVAPTVKRSAEGTPVAGFEKEMRACKSQKDIETVMRKYGKL